jgi:aspartate/methionine/tyrosine aminotransferase
MLISDEIYEAIVFEGRRHISPSLRDRTVLVNSLSKTYSMPGWRVGYCAGPASVIRDMLLVLQQSSRGPSTFVQDAAAAALTGPQGCVAEMVTEYARRRRAVLDGLSGIRGCQVLPPEGGFFAMLDVSGIGLLSNEIRRKILTQSGVVVIHGSAYGEGGEGTLRVSFAGGGQTLARGLAWLRIGLERI